MAARALFFVSRRKYITLTLLSQPFQSISVLPPLHPYPHSHKYQRPFSSQSPALVAAHPLYASVDVNEICRVISDQRGPHHDLEFALSPYASRLSNDIVEQVLKRTKNLGFAAHRFFLWAKKFPGFQPSFSSYKILITTLGSTKQFPLIWDLLYELRDSEDESSRLCPDVFYIVFGAYCAAKTPGDAIRAFNRMSDFGLKPTGDDLDHLLYLLCKRKFVSNAQEFFEEIKHEFPPSVKTYSILIRGWGDVGDPGTARKVFDEMLERGCVVDVPAYNSLLEALCKGGEVDEAYKMFREMGPKGIEPNACTYSVFIRAYCQGNNVYSAFKVLDRMQRYSLVPNVYTYNCLIKRLCSNEKVDEAYQVLDEMVGRGVEPDEWSYNTIMNYHCDHCEVNRALKLVSRMDKLKREPDRHAYNMLLKMLIRIGRFDRVKEVWDSMETRGFYPPVSTYAVMIHGLLKKRGKVEEACKYFEVMIDEGIPPYISTCEVLRNKLVGFGLVELIHVLGDKMERSTSCAIREMSRIIRGDRIGQGRSRSRREEHSAQSDDDWVSSWGSKEGG